jgi:hypothetical protein
MSHSPTYTLDTAPSTSRPWLETPMSGPGGPRQILNLHTCA